MVRCMTTMPIQFLLGFILLILMPTTQATHYRGGIITWRALNTTPSSSGTAQVLIRQRHSWRRTYWPSSMCTDARIASGQLIGSGTGWLSCYGGGSCSSYTAIRADVICTDFSADTTLDYSSGERVNTTTLPLNAVFVLGFYGNAWMALAIRGNSDWQITGKIDLTVRPDGILNTSPVTSTLPVIYKTVNIQHVHIIQMSDADSLDTLKCRWSTNNLSPTNWNTYDECGSVCSPTLPTGFQLFSNNCTLVFTLTTVNYYAVALQIEDFYTPTSPTPMSSVPIQFLFLGRTSPGGCATPPVITGVRPNLACIGTPINSLTNETVIAEVSCTGKTIVEFVTSSPIGLRKSAIMNPSTGVYTIVLTWTPTAEQYGPQGFCAGAIDNTGVQSTPWCITFLVGFTAPNLQKPLFVQHSASPLGTILSNHSIFAIQSVNGVGVNRPGRNGTYVHFNDASLNGTRVLSFDCGWSPHVIYSGSTIIINTYPYNNWTYGHHYYITFDSGASSGVDFCRAESEPLIDPAFWRFNIWDPRLSSTTSSTTTTPNQTLPTITTRGPSTTTAVANLTTTGIIITTTSPASLTTITATTTTATTTTTETTALTTSTLPAVSVISPKEYEEACKQPIAIGTAVMMLTMLPINFIAMFSLFSKVEKMFNPHRLQQMQRQQTLASRLNNRH